MSPRTWRGAPALSDMPVSGGKAVWKYTIKRVSKILVPREKIYFPRQSRGKYVWSRGTRILLTFEMVYFNCFFILKEKREGIWLSPMTRAPTSTDKSKTQRDNIKQRHQNFDYTTMADWHQTNFKLLPVEVYKSNAIFTVLDISSKRDKERDLTQS